MPPKQADRELTALEDAFKCNAFSLSGLTARVFMLAMRYARPAIGALLGRGYCPHCGAELNALHVGDGEIKLEQ